MSIIYMLNVGLFTKGEKMAKVQLSDHFTYKRLIRFIWPSIVMMIFTSIYGVVDGIFVSNYTGKTPFAAINFIYPFIMILAAPGFMLGTGGSALVSKTLGEGKREKANKLFSLFCAVALVAGAVLTVLGFVLMPAVARLLNADEGMMPYCVLYGRIVVLGCVPQILHFVFEGFNVTAEKPGLGLKSTVAAGLTNIALDALFVGAFRWGVAGAASATVISQTVGASIPLIYFLRPNNSLLRITKTEFDSKSLIKACTNGSSELMSNISMSLVGMIYNTQLMKYFGEDGVAAYGVMMYVNMIFISAFIGYAIGTAPIVGFHYGAKNKTELNNILKKSIVILGIGGLTMFTFGEVFASPLSGIFVSYDEKLFEVTVHGFRIFSGSFLFCGLAIFGSSFFTALNDGVTSAIISFMRTLVFELSSLLLLPLIFGGDGVWYSAVVAEVMAVVLSSVFLVIKRKKFGYY